VGGVGELRRQGGAADHACRLGVVQADQQAFDRRIGIHRQPGGARLRDRRLHHQQLDPARHPESQDVARFDAGIDEARGGQACQAVKFGVGELALALDQGNLRGRTLGGRFQQVGEDFFAQQCGLRRAIQDIGVPGTDGGIVNRLFLDWHGCGGGNRQGRNA
jgi:hypothetical protein